MKFFQKLFGPKEEAVTYPRFTAEPASDEALFVVGDVHGRADLLKKLLPKQPEGTRLIFVGDLVDRGDESAEVLEIVRELCADGAICLIGNHEKMMLDFLERPTERGGRWIRYGGLQTLQSFGVRGVNERAGDAELLAARDVLRDVLPEGMEDWLRSLPLQWSSGNVHVVHAAADPEVPMDQQDPKVLIWGSKRFFEIPRTDNQWVVHGHTIVNEVHAEDGRIAIDTGAYATGRLSGLILNGCGISIQIS